MPKLFDAHAHVVSLKQAPENYVVSSSAELSDWDSILDLTRKFGERVFAGLGVHPYEVLRIGAEQCEQALCKLETYLQEYPHIVALAECGIDLRYGQHELQIAVFERHLSLARKYNKAVVVHCVRGYHVLEEIFARIKPGLRVILHDFRASSQISDWALERGFYLSFGCRRLKSSASLERVMSSCAPDRILVESDTEATQNYEPHGVWVLLEELARLRTVSPETLCAQILQNARQAFDLGQAFSV